MRKILLHNLSIPYVGQSPDLYHFDKNGVYFAEEGDTVVVRDGLYDWESLLGFLKEVGAIVRDINVVYSGANISYLSVFDDFNLKDKLDPFVYEKTPLDVFMPTKHECGWSEQFGLSAPARLGQYERYTGKSNFRSLANRVSVPVPDGSVYLHSSLSIARAAIRLFLRGAKEVVVKDDGGVAGLSSRRLTIEGFKKTALRLWKYKDLFPREDIERNGHTSYIVEEWHSDVIMRPSVQCYISGDGPEIISMHDQKMRANQMSYAGCYSEHWLSQDLIFRLEKHSHTLLDALYNEGFRGHLAFNTILTSEDELLFTEVNPRRAVSSYPFRVMENLGWNRSNMWPYQLQEINKSAWRGLSPTSLLEILGEKLFDRNKRTGLLPLDCKLLREEGTVMIMAISHTKEQVDELLNQVV